MVANDEDSMSHASALQSKKASGFFIVEAVEKFEQGMSNDSEVEEVPESRNARLEATEEVEEAVSVDGAKEKSAQYHTPPTSDTTRIELGLSNEGPVDSRTVGVRVSHMYQCLDIDGQAAPQIVVVSTHNETMYGASSGIPSLVSGRLSYQELRPHFEVMGKLGSVKNSRVALVRDRHTGSERVCKLVPSNGIGEVRAEVDILRKLDHPRIVKLYEHSDDCSVLILEYMASGTCANLLLQHALEAIREEAVARIAQDLFEALAFCHSRRVIHRDVKLLNMALTPNGNCKLIDFGLALQLETDESVIHMPDAYPVGTSMYMAPQVMCREPYAREADVWSAGISVMELLCGKLPYRSVIACQEFLSNYGGFAELETRLAKMPWWSSRSVEAQNFVRSLLQRERSLRPTAAVVLMDPWIVQNGLTSEALSAFVHRSLEEYLVADVVTKCCLLVIAARLGHSDMVAIESAFLSNCQHLDVVKVSLDESRISSALSFTEFAAACIGSHYSSAREFSADAFRALDDKRSGLLCVEEVITLFGELGTAFRRDEFLDQPLTTDAWVDACLAIGVGVPYACCLS